MNDDELASGKRRSFSQRVGTDGELAFRVFANRHGLLPTKVEEDFGIDFLFQIDLDHQSKEASDIANTFAGACVRASRSDMGKVTLNRGDAANLLNSRSPLMFVLAHVTGEAESAIMYHRLVDESFMAELQAFLDTEHKTVSVLPSDCLPEDRFKASLGTLLSPGFTESVRLAAAEAGLNSVLPSATVEIRRQADGQLTLVSNVDYFSLFEQFDENQERDLLHAAFGVEAHLVQRVAQLNPRPEVIKYLRALPQPALLTGYTTQARVVLEVTLNGVGARTEFTFRRIGTHYAYVHEAGISLIVSHARERDGQMVHDTEVFIDPLADNVLDDLGEGLDFFEMCVEGAVIRVGRENPTTVGGFDVAKFFLPLQTVGAMIRAWRTCKLTDGWPEQAVALKDAADPEIFYTLSGFARLLDSPESIAQHSFFLESLNHPISVDDLVESPGTALVPIIGNIAGSTLVLELVATAYILGLEGEVRGFRFVSTQAASVEVRELVAKTSIHPELVPGDESPTFAIAPARTQGVLPPQLGDLAIGWKARSEDADG